MGLRSDFILASASRNSLSRCLGPWFWPENLDVCSEIEIIIIAVDVSALYSRAEESSLLFTTISYCCVTRSVLSSRPDS